MSELIQKNGNRATIRRTLLTGASALVLTAYISSAGMAMADDADRPPLWIELGGQLDMIEGTGKPFTAPFFFQSQPSPIFEPTSPSSAQKAPRFGFGEEGKISFEPQGTDWLFTAAVRYGRSNGTRNIHQQTDTVASRIVYHYTDFYGNTHPTQHFPETGEGKYEFLDVRAVHRESHMVLDFQAGKDVGLGMFGHNAESNISFGVRIAQFDSSSDVSIRARPYRHQYNILPHNFFPPQYLPVFDFHDYFLTAQSRRSFHGMGPSLSWKASAPIVGRAESMQFTIDWGINAAVLFGRQKAHTHHQTTGNHFHPKYGGNSHYMSQFLDTHAPSDRSRGVTVPNVGGFAGVSFKFPNAKISIGYRGDFFFGAVDSGIDAAEKSTLGFNGPFATISVGIGG